MLNKYLHKIAYLFIFFTLLLIFINWYGDSQYLISADNNLIIDLEKYINQKISTWQSKYYPGSSDFFRSPFGSFEYFFSNIFLLFSADGEKFLKSINIFLFLCAFISINKFLSLFKFRLNKIILYILSLSYVFNIYNIIIIGSFNPVIFRISFYPLFLYYFVKFFRNLELNPKPFINNINLFKLVLVYFFCIVPSYQTPPYIFIDFLIVFILIIFYPRRLWFNYQLYILIFLILAVSSFFLYGFIFEYFFTDLNQLLYIHKNFSPDYHFNLNSIFLSSVHKLDGYFGFYSSFRGYPYYPASSFFNKNILFSFYSFTVFVGIYYLIFLKENKNDTDKFTLLCLIIFSLLIAGKNSFFGDFIKLLIIDNNLIGLLRSVYQRFGNILSIVNTVLIIYGYQLIFEKINKFNLNYNLVKSLKFVYLIGFIFTLKPHIDGSILDTSGFGSKRVTLPDYYSELKDHINKYQNSNNLVLPHSQINIWVFDWNNLADGYGGQYPLNNDIDGSFFNFYVNSEEEYQINQFIFNPDNFDSIQNMNISNIIIHYDFNFSFMESQWYYQPSKNMYETIIKIDNILKNNENYERHVFDKIVVYSLKDLNKFQFPLELKYQ